MKLLPFLLIVIAHTTSFAGMIFQFDNQTTAIGIALDNQTSGTFGVGGIQMTATASTGVFNTTADNFGINQQASNDDTDGFDFTEGGGSGVAEGLTIKFDQNVLLENFDVSSFNAGNDQISLKVGASNVATVTGTGTTSLGNFALTANTDLLISTTGGIYGNGWSLDSIEVSAAPVPEPSSMLLAGGLTLLLIGHRRRKV
ncbi:MAG: PEP-CTERM sorting domain-containing protein [Verrucomicrobiaceae bacterium]|nr:PEP-CTERM sorting domain-containing protein [Verrucomicrobiaceae bacterium]